MILERLHNLIATHNSNHNRKYKLSLSVGVVLYDPSNPLTVDELISRADGLMYEHKRRNLTKK